MDFREVVARAAKESVDTKRLEAEQECSVRRLECSIIRSSFQHHVWLVFLSAVVQITPRDNLPSEWVLTKQVGFLDPVGRDAEHVAQEVVDQLAQVEFEPRLKF